MRDLAIDMGAADVPGTPEQSILINNGEGLAIVPATLHPGDDDTTIPHRVFFLEQWMAGLGHYWYEWPRHDAQHILYRDWKTAVTACKDLAADADAAYADEQLFQHAPGAFSLIQKPNDRDVWRVRVISEAVHLVEEAAL
jgi:hypothetical protein